MRRWRLWKNKYSLVVHFKGVDKCPLELSVFKVSLCFKFHIGALERSLANITVSGCCPRAAWIFSSYGLAGRQQSFPTTAPPHTPPLACLRGLWACFDPVGRSGDWLWMRPEVTRLKARAPEWRQMHSMTEPEVNQNETQHLCFKWEVTLVRSRKNKGNSHEKQKGQFHPGTIKVFQHRALT